MSHAHAAGGASKSDGETRALLSFVQALRWHDLAPEIRHAARRHMFDTIGVMIAGCAGDLVDRAEAMLAALRPAGQVAVPGRRRRADPLDAAFLAGVGAHGVELDDGYRQGSVHPGVAIAPALMAAAHGRQISGARLLEAVVAGYETIAAIAEFCHPELRRRGFHPTSVVGPLGAAMAVGKLLDLDERQLANALGLAASSGAGLFAFLGGGGDVKRLHAGHAAREGLMAALLAREGVAGPPDVLEAADGFFQAFAFGAAAAPRAFLLPPQSPFRITDCYIKPYACCRHLQPAIEALLSLRAQHGLTAGNVAAIEIETYGIAAEHAHTGWADFASAQLSFPFVMALALHHGGVDLAHFDAARRGDPQLAQIAARVTVRRVADLDALYPQFRPARVTVKLTSGAAHSAYSPEALGSALTPFDDARLRRKFRALVAPVLGDGRARDLETALWTIDAADDIAGRFVFD